MFQKVLVANRGEIAIRVMRAANELGKKTVAIYAEEDKLSLHRFKADEAYQVGEGLGPVAAYLNIEDVIRIARRCGADAIHPGYGLLSENPAFADACKESGIAFIGPKSESMRMLGDKASARRAAIAAGVPVIPATEVLGEDMEAIRAEAGEIGYPLMLKASWGGGGRGMRPILGPEELEEKVREGRREAEAAFGNGEGYLEKMILRARHVEVQVLGDHFGNLYHLYERDCSVQRRNQKVVERAPAPYLTDEQRSEICELALKIARHANYQCAGTVEFLMDMEDDSFYFIEVNPRVQVEHTVTEEVTGIDIVKAQIRITEGASLAEATGKAKQADIDLSGHALQCRVTTEDPRNNFIPDYGRITAYRGATGFGIRLDGGTAYSGAVITRYYDSLLEKVTAWAPTPSEAIARMDRALREFRIRGVATNIAFVENLLRHPTFLDNTYTTKFIDTTPDLFDFKRRRDRATKLLTFIADVSINGNPEAMKRPDHAKDAMPPKPPRLMTDRPSAYTAKALLDQKGAKAVADWMLEEKRLLITDTTMRDGHQSLLATRMRSVDMLNVAEAYAHNLPGLFSMECWGGATFDVAYRFLQECPWKRLTDLRALMPNLLLQMLLRASNGVGYTNYADNVVEKFVAQSAASGIDLFRVFDPLNWVENMRVAMDAVLESGKILEASICYTGDIHDPERAKYPLQYYVSLARELEAAGSHVLCIKDMGGLVKPAAARALVSALKDEISIPIHFHTHDTGGTSAASILAASEAGVDAVDAAMDAFSGMTSQPCLGSIVEALRHQDRDTGLNPSTVRDISRYWEGVRRLYAGFESDMRSGTSEVYLHEMPGGQVTNLRAQARAMGLEDRWNEVAKTYADVNRMFGDVIKVTPIAKTVGDMALTLVAGGHKAEEMLDPDVDISFPESVVTFFKGEVGQPYGGFPAELQKRVLKGVEPITVRPGSLMPPVDLEAVRAEVTETLDGHQVDDEDLCAYLMYPKVYLDYMGRRRKYGPVRVLPTPTFFYGMKPGDEISADLRPGVRLVIRLQAISDPDEKGEVKVFFELNGQPRTIRIDDIRFSSDALRAERADPSNPNHVPAPMPGIVGSVAVVVGQEVKPGDLLLTMEAMKMETALHAEHGGTVKRIVTPAGTQVDAKDLLIELGQRCGGRGAVSLDLKSLELFLRVAALGAIGRAGAEFNLSPTNATQRIKALEAGLGVTLLNRTTRAVSLTPDGEIFLDHALRILEEVEQTRLAMSRTAGRVAGLVRVTASSTFAHSHVVPFVPEFLARHPDVTLDLNFTDTVIDIVGQGYDLAFRSGALAPSSLLAQKIDDNPQALVAAPEYLERAGHPETPQDLANHACLPLGQTHVWKLIAGDGTLHEVAVSGPIKVNLGNAVSAWVRAGLGIGQTALWHAGPDIRAGRILRVLPGYRVWPEANIWAVRPPGRMMPARVRAFLDFMQQRIVETNQARYGGLL